MSGFPPRSSPSRASAALSSSPAQHNPDPNLPQPWTTPAKPEMNGRGPLPTGAPESTHWLPPAHNPLLNLAPQHQTYILHFRPDQLPLGVRTFRSISEGFPLWHTGAPADPPTIHVWPLSRPPTLVPIPHFPPASHPQPAPPAQPTTRVQPRNQQLPVQPSHPPPSYSRVAPIRSSTYRELPFPIPNTPGPRRDLGISHLRPSVSSAQLTTSASTPAPEQPGQEHPNSPSASQSTSTESTSSIDSDDVRSLNETYDLESLRVLLPEIFSRSSDRPIPRESVRMPVGTPLHPRTAYSEAARLNSVRQPITLQQETPAEPPPPYSRSESRDTVSSISERYQELLLRAPSAYYRGLDLPPPTPLPKPIPNTPKYLALRDTIYAEFTRGIRSAPHRGPPPRHLKPAPNTPKYHALVDTAFRETMAEQIRRSNLFHASPSPKPTVVSDPVEEFYRDVEATDESLDTILATFPSNFARTFSSDVLVAAGDALKAAASGSYVTPVVVPTSTVARPAFPISPSGRYDPSTHHLVPRNPEPSYNITTPLGHSW